MFNLWLIAVKRPQFEETELNYDWIDELMADIECSQDQNGLLPSSNNSIFRRPRFSGFIRKRVEFGVCVFQLWMCG